MFKKNDRVKLVRKPCIPINTTVGEIFKITDINNELYNFNLVSEATGEKIRLTHGGMDKYFKKAKEPAEDKPLEGVPYEKIEKLMAEANLNVTTFFDKTTVVAAQFPNGFVITESSSCVDPRAYDEEEGKQICLKRIKERLWEMEGYFLQEQECLWKESVVKSENKEMEKEKNEVTQEIARAAHKDLMATFKKEYERDESSNLEEVYYKRMEEISREFNVEQDELAKGIAEISAENIYREFMNRFFEISL